MNRHVGPFARLASQIDDKLTLIGLIVFDTLFTHVERTPHCVPTNSSMLEQTLHNSGFHSLHTLSIYSCFLWLIVVFH